MKINRFPIMKKTGLLQTAYGLASMLFSLLTAYSLSGITEKIQASAVDEGIEQCLWLLLILIFYGISLIFFSPSAAFDSHQGTASGEGRDSSKYPS